MNERNIMIEQFLCGNMDITDFIDLFLHDNDLQDYLRNILSNKEYHSPDHPIWARFSFDALHTFDFDIYEYMKNARMGPNRKIYEFDGEIGNNLNIFGIIEYFYTYFFPDAKCTSYYHDCFDLYLDSVQDCFEGPEVLDQVNAVINDVLQSFQLKTKRKTEAKKRVKELFHYEGKRPFWIQGPEWPMGVKTPMAYLESKKIADGKEYVFYDADTGERRIITQYY